MLGLRTKKENAERLRRFLSERALLSKEYKIFRGNSYIYFPLTAGPDEKDVEKVKVLGRRPPAGASSRSGGGRATRTCYGGSGTSSRARRLRDTTSWATSRS